MELSERDRRELAAIERMMAGQDPLLARRLSSGFPERGRPAALPLAQVVALVPVLALLCAVHAAVPDLHWTVSAVLTTVLIGTWLSVACRALPGSPPVRTRRRGSGPPRSDDPDGPPPAGV